VKMNFHFRVMPRLRMNGAIPPLPLIPSWLAQRRLFYFVVVVKIVLNKQLFDASRSKSLQKNVVFQRAVNYFCSKHSNCRIFDICFTLFTGREGP
jgi:hypothetical protein